MSQPTVIRPQGAAGWACLRRVGLAGTTAGCGSPTGATEEIVAVDLDGKQRGRRARRARPGLVDRLAARRPPARDRRGAHCASEPDGSMVRHADLSGSRRPRLERDRRRRPRQHLREQHRLRLHGRRGAPARDHRPGHARRGGPPGRRRHRVPQRHGRHPRQLDARSSSESFAGRLTAFDIAADGSLSNRRVWAEGIGPDGICHRRRGCDLDPLGGHPHPHRARRRPAGECVRVSRGRRDPAADRARPGRLRLRARRSRTAGRCSCSPPSGEGIEHVDDVDRRAAPGRSSSPTLRHQASVGRERRRPSPDRRRHRRCARWARGWAGEQDLPGRGDPRGGRPRPGPGQPRRPGRTDHVPAARPRRALRRARPGHHLPAARRPGGPRHPRGVSARSSPGRSPRRRSPRVPDEALRGAGLSANKLASLRDLSAKVLDGTVVLERVGPRIRRRDRRPADARSAASAAGRPRCT